MAGCAKTDERMLERGLPGEGGTARPKEPRAPPRGLRSKALPGVDTIGGIGTAMEVTAAAPACEATSSPESLKKMEGAVLSGKLAAKAISEDALERQGAGASSGAVAKEVVGVAA